MNGYFRLDRSGVLRPYINLDVEFQEPHNVTYNVTFAVDTGADHTLLSPAEGYRLQRYYDFNIHSLNLGPSLAGIGGRVDTRTINATLYLGSYWITMPVPIIDALPGPNTMPSLLGRDIIDEFALFMERRTERVLLLDDGEVEEFINISG